MTNAPNKVELAAALGVDRRTITNWLRVPGNPGARSNGKYHVPTWKAWALKQGKAPLGTDARSLKEQLTAIQIERQRHKLKVEQRQHVPVKDVEAMGARLAAAIRKVVTTLHREAPDLEMRTKEEIEVRLRAKEDEIVAQLYGLEKDLEVMREDVVIEEPKEEDDE